MSSYCKAYRLGDLRRFPGWMEKAENARKEKVQREGQEVEVPRELTDDVYVYVHENFVVTDGIFENENVIFDDVTPEWEAFCRNELKFEVPDWVKSSANTEVKATDS